MRPQNKQRSRNKNNNNNNNNNRRHMGNIINRVFDSAGPEGKVRGTPQQIIEKYQSLARDAQLSNDRVAEQNFLQHAEHYLRLLAEALSQQAEMRQQNEAMQGDRPIQDQQPEEGEPSFAAQPGNGHQPGFQGHPQPAYLQPRGLDPVAGFDSPQDPAQMEQPEIGGLVETPEESVPQSLAPTRERGPSRQRRRPAPVALSETQAPE
jgi:hypothetical protein